MDKDEAGYSPRVGNTDAAALAASGVAIVLATYLDEGRYELLGALVSLTLTVTLLAYLWGPGKTGWQTFAFAAVVGLAITPFAGFLFEWIWSEDRGAFFAWRDPPQTVSVIEGSELASSVGSLTTAATWLAVTLFVFSLSVLTVGTANKPKGDKRSGKAAKETTKEDPGSSPG